MFPPVLPGSCSLSQVSSRERSCWSYRWLGLLTSYGPLIRVVSVPQGREVSLMLAIATSPPRRERKYRTKRPIFQSSLSLSFILTRLGSLILGRLDVSDREGGGGPKEPFNGIFLDTARSRGNEDVGDMETLVDPLCFTSRVRVRQAEAILKIAPSGTERRPRPEGLNRLPRIVEHSGTSSYTSRSSTTDSLLSR